MHNFQVNLFGGYSYLGKCCSTYARSLCSLMYVFSDGMKLLTRPFSQSMI